MGSVLSPNNRISPNRRLRYDGGMPNLNRRELCIALSAFAALGTGISEAQTAAQPAATALSRAEVFPVDQMHVTKMANGGESLSIIRGTLTTGESVALHESVQAVGAPPNPPHRIQHSEFIMVREGTLKFMHDGQSQQVGAGGVIYVAYGTLHSVRNVGKVPAKYFVIAIGGDTKR